MNKPKLGVIALRPNDIFQRTVISGVQKAALEYNYDLVVWGFEQAPTNLASADLEALDGVLIVANAISDAAILNIYRSGQPFSLVCHQIPETPIPSVMAKNMQGIAELVRHLAVGCHRRDLVFIRG